jgi:hypothetical protein
MSPEDGIELLDRLEKLSPERFELALARLEVSHALLGIRSAPPV